ncbi:MAG: ribose-5-phosphate isomerase RpiA [Planctomycetota bacterium]
MSEAKRAAGRRAAEFVEDGMALGLGTGSTVFYTLERLAERIREEHLSLRCIPTSIDTETKANEMGIPLATFSEVETLDLTIDGADEIDGDFQMIKGGGGALLREKVVAAASKREVIVVDRSKVVERLGVRFLLPVEVVPFARHNITRWLEHLSAQPNLRMRDEGEVYRTDNGNEILDCRFPGGIEDPAELERRLSVIPGVVESGLFIDLCHVLVVGDEGETVEVREKP